MSKGKGQSQSKGQVKGNLKGKQAAIVPVKKGKTLGKGRAPVASGSQQGKKRTTQ